METSTDRPVTVSLLRYTYRRAHMNAPEALSAPLHADMQAASNDAPAAASLRSFRKLAHTPKHIISPHDTHSSLPIVIPPVLKQKPQSASFLVLCIKSDDK